MNRIQEVLQMSISRETLLERLRMEVESAEEDLRAATIDVISYREAHEKAIERRQNALADHKRAVECLREAESK